MKQYTNNLNELKNAPDNDPTVGLHYLRDLLGIELMEIQAAVTAVGYEPVKVERYLRDKLGLV